MVLYFDAAQERIVDASAVEFERAVEGARLGTVFAHNAKAHSRWRRSFEASRSRTRRGLVGETLDQAISALAMSRPDLVMAA